MSLRDSVESNRAYHYRYHSLTLGARQVVFRGLSPHGGMVMPPLNAVGRPVAAVPGMARDIPAGMARPTKIQDGGRDLPYECPDLGRQYLADDFCYTNLPEVCSRMWRISSRFFAACSNSRLRAASNISFSILPNSLASFSGGSLV